MKWTLFKDAKPQKRQFVDILFRETEFDQGVWIICGVLGDAIFEHDVEMGDAWWRPMEELPAGTEYVVKE